MEHINRTISLKVGFALLLGLVCLSACSSKAQRDQANFEKDTVALNQVRRIQSSIGATQSIHQSDLDILKNVHSKYPAASEVRQTLQAALQTRQDWTALEVLMLEKPESERSQDEKVYLIKIFIKLGKYGDANRIAMPMAEASPNDLEVNSLAGHSAYFEGKYDDAARIFDRVWDALAAAKQVDEIMMRGMIFFYKGDTERAIETLRRTVELKPDYIAGNNALARVYASKGDQEKADYYRKQAEEAHARQSVEEARQMRAASRARDLENAFAAGRFNESVQISLEMLQYVNDAQKPALYEYLGKSYQATGKQAEAQAAFQEAARLRQQLKS